MCGIVGARGTTDGATLSAMLDLIDHRGPDGEGRFVDEDTGVMLGARRLAIVDLDGGDQPVTNEDGTVVVTFNGEIYNHEALREELRHAGHRFRSACDTEVLVHLWEDEGPGMVERLDGMFAFAVWDADADRLFLARDRLGIKPLYYGLTPRGVVWASEIPPLLAAGVDRRLDPAAVYDYFRLEYTPWPRTLFASVRKLPPGAVAEVTRDGVETHRYWTPSVGSASSVGSVAAASARLRDLLEGSVERRLMADVPVGAFLSGGLDSSAITALMTERTDDLRTFAVTFPGQPYDEGAEARLVADALGTDHHEVAVDLASLSGFEELVGRLSEPPSHVQFLPILALSRLTRDQGVDVALAGEGADELFGGYPRYRHVRRARPLVGTLPGPVYDVADRFAGHSPLRRDYLGYLAGLRSPETAVLEHDCGFDCLRPRPDAILDTRYDDRTSGLVESVRTAIDGVTDDAAQAMMAWDVAHLLPDYVLFKTDHTSMAASLEVRVPFLDHRLVAFAHRLPVDYRVTPGDEKAVLRRAVADLLPRPILERRKYGMGIPVGEWFRTDEDAIARWLDEARLEATPYVDPERVDALWADHRRGRVDHGRTLWTVVSFVAWYHAVVAERPVERAAAR